MSKDISEGDSSKSGFLSNLREAFSRNRRSVSEDEIKELVDDADELLV